jgi:hypothetical protein
MPLPASYETIPVRTRCADDADRGFLDTLFASDGRIEMALAADKSGWGELIEGIFLRGDRGTFTLQRGSRPARRH